MTEKNKYIATVSILVTIITALIISMLYTANLFEQVEQNYISQMNTLQQRINNLSGQINGIQSSVLNQLKKESSIIADYKIEQRSFNVETLKLDVLVSVTPKSYNKNATAYVVLNDGKRHELTNNNGIFTAILPLSPNADYSVTFSFDNDGTHVSEKIDDMIWLSSYFYEISKSYIDIRRTQYSEGIYKLLDSEAHISIKPLGGKVTSARIYALVEDKQAWSEDVTAMLSNTGNNYYTAQLAITKSIEAQDNDNVKLLAEIIDEKGFIYTISFFNEMVETDNSTMVYADGMLKIKAPNGAIIK